MSRILEKQLRYDIDRLRADFRLMSELVHLGLTEAVEALREADRAKAYEVILRDSRIDSLESTIDQHCLEFMVKHTPVASNLRFVYSAAKISFELERVGDYAETIARQAIELSYSPRHSVTDLILEMSKVSLRMFYQAVQAFLESDVESANETMTLDPLVDDYERKIYETLSGENIRGSQQARRFHSLLTVANRLERVADQACNICEEVVYMTTGEVIKHHHDKEFRVLFLCVQNACRSQMAEAIGKKLTKSGRIHYFSAGGEPAKQMDAMMVEFMGKRGYDLRGQWTKSLKELPALDHFNVLVTLCHEACVNLPKIPFKTVALHWDVEEPSGKEEDYEKIHHYLETHIRDLMSALDQ